ncbi:MAG TPA: beta-ketoacyl-ACP synthase [Rhizomicrobium sp.]|jgi:3-oxoacyl-[acyl-carrier-protein] synthase-1|nr:beta-ketoacyl-ACP synthase [Rhizomicrobium sp.]
MMQAVYIHEFAIACALGEDAQTVRTNLISSTTVAVRGRACLGNGRFVPAGVLPLELSGRDSRCNLFADHCLKALGGAVADHMQQTGPLRFAVIIGTSTSGVREGGAAFDAFQQRGHWPDEFRFSAQELGDTAAHVARCVGARGPVYGISTACTSGAKALASAARLVQAGLCDAALAGGIDSLCDLTLNGFAALGSLSEAVCNPFSKNRCGLNLGEGGALFVLSARPSPVRLAGWGESVDGHHISAPDPEGKGAMAAMERALAHASLRWREIGYLNLHGTATKLNDLMEARAVSRIFGAELPCSSTKPMTGHMLGAAGACEAAFSIMALQTGRLPAHIWDGEFDPEMPPIRLVAGTGEASDARRAMSCSYAFGGNNIALILETE